ncbi:MAG: right-handed parallel beta-helix repeat-containing protein [Candidatus Bipolaricaulota bacterium]|nr:right-handed parallel beta-helix repeat-containing protein [Candidatus Bipolaricaulota bacterium]
MKQGVALVGVLILLVGVGLSCVAGAERAEHTAIVITNDYEFTPSNGVCSGSGTAEDPYVIQGWKIDAGYDDYGVRVHGTTRYFIVRDVEVAGAAKAGMSLSYVRNGRIEGCLLDANWVGVVLSYSTFVRISDCVFETNTDGVHLFYSGENQILYNVFDRNDTSIWLDASNRNEITGNLIHGSHMGAYLNLGSTGNRVLMNAFVANLHNAYSDEPNVWNSDRQGNYWNEFDAIDANEDGIWDSPYLINSDGDQDSYPLVTHPLVPTPEPETCDS